VEVRAEEVRAEEVRAEEVRAVEVRAVEVRAVAKYRKTRVTMESVVVCFGANTFHWLNVCLFEGF